MQNLDTIGVERVAKYLNPEDPLSLRPIRVQSLFVIADRDLLEIDAYEHDSDVRFRIRLGEDDLLYPSTAYTVSELDAMEAVNDIIKIPAIQSYDNLKGLPFDLRYFVWHKKYGYVGLGFEDGFSWKLTSFVRRGEEIYVR